MARVQSAPEVNVVASVAGAPHCSVEVVATSTGLVETIAVDCQPRCIDVARNQIINLRDRAFAGRAVIEATTEGARIGGTSVVVGEVDNLVSTTLVLAIVGGSHLAVEGAGMAEEGNGAQEERNLHLVDWVCERSCGD